MHFYRILQGKQVEDGPLSSLSCGDSSTGLVKYQKFLEVNKKAVKLKSEDTPVSTKNLKEECKINQ